MGFALSDMTVTSSAFEPHSPIPEKHSREGGDVSPPLAWDGAPDGTRSFAVMCHDPDAPLVKPGSYGFSHWVLYGIPSSVSSLEEGSDVGVQGRNDFGDSGYGGPRPPSGHGTHHYYFWVLALDEDLDLEPGLDLAGFLERAEPHVLGMNRLIGTFRND